MTAARDLEATLLALEPALEAAQHPWWILGSAAVVLHGADPLGVADVDVLLDQRDSVAVLGRLGLTPMAGEGNTQFRSAVFNLWAGSILPVELFAGFCLCEGGVWSEFVPQTRIAVWLGEAQAFVPEREELIALLRRFGRPKDLVRIAALNESGQSPSRSETA